MIFNMVADNRNDVHVKREAAVECGNYGKLVGSRVGSGQIMGHSFTSRTACRRSSSGRGLSPGPFDSSFKLNYLLVIVIQLVFLSSFCRGGVLGGGFRPSLVKAEAGRGKGRLLLTRSTSVPQNCSHFLTAVQGETCASLRASSGLSQAQIFELNPELNCKTILAGQSICVEGISAYCGGTVAVTAGSTTPTCTRIAADGNVTMHGFQILNPGISCPEDSGNNNVWPNSQLVCGAPGLGKIFVEYIGDSGKPITFDQVQLLYGKYPSVIRHLVLAFAVDSEANGTRTNGVFHPYWNSALSPASATAFKAANPDVRLLVSLGGPSSTWDDPPTSSAATKWIDTAYGSLTTIATDYSIDGIDIAYQNFTSSHANFVYCVGTLIRRLKDNNIIGLATVAPGQLNQLEYYNVLNTYDYLIDYVNFQFYTYQLGTVGSYIAQYNTIAGLVSPWKLVASTQIGGTKSITGLQFLQAVEQIFLERGIHGVMLFDADNSVGNNFQDENLVLSLLTGEPYSNITNSTTSGPALAPSPSPSLGPAKSPVPSSGPAPPPGAPRSSLAPGPLAPGAPALSPGSPHSSSTPRLAPGSSLAPGSGSPGSSPAAPGSSFAPGAPGSGAPGSGSPGSTPVGSAGAPGSGTGNSPPPVAPSPSSAPQRLLGSEAWFFRGFGLLTGSFILLFSL